jgi:hypothetical protein
LKAPGVDHAEAINRLRAMPKEFAWLMIVTGIAGVVLPVAPGTPFLVLGCLMLWPGAFEHAELSMEKWFPTLNHYSMAAITRYMDDLERRYPYPD